jgi:thiol:disulfide interchange protein DsbC
MNNNKSPAPASAKCTAPTDKVKELAKKFRINGTPTMFFVDGQRVPGYMPADKLEEMLKTVAAK